MMPTGSPSSEGAGEFPSLFGVGLVFIKNEFEKLLPPTLIVFPTFPACEPLSASRANAARFALVVSDVHQFTVTEIHAPDAESFGDRSPNRRLSQSLQKTSSTTFNGLTNIGVEFKQSLVFYKTGIEGQTELLSNHVAEFLSQ
jgi:hypothetical protein